MPAVANRRLRVEPLEDRALPADFGLFGLFGGDISAPSFPVMADSVVLDAAQGRSPSSSLAAGSGMTGATRVRVPSFPLAADSMMAAAARVRSPAASFLAPAATGIVFHRTPDATAEPVVPAVPEFDPAQVVRSRPKEVDEPLGEVVLKLPPPPQVVEYELPEYADETEEAAATAAPAARTVVVEEFAGAESAPVEPVPAFAGDITATPGVADLLGAADQFLDTLGAALADPTAPVALWERVGYWAVSIGAVGVALEVARQRLRVRSPHTEAPTLVVRQ